MFIDSPNGQAQISACASESQLVEYEVAAGVTADLSSESIPCIRYLLII
jgi:hypothetical protein